MSPTEACMFANCATLYSASTVGDTRVGSDTLRALIQSTAVALAQAGAGGGLMFQAAPGQAAPLPQSTPSSTTTAYNWWGVEIYMTCAEAKDLVYSLKQASLAIGGTAGVDMVLASLAAMGPAGMAMAGILAVVGVAILTWLQLFQNAIENALGNADCNGVTINLTWVGAFSIDVGKTL
ncbi:MAG: hypothetical protein K8T90_18810 [Planctomycetes bacterium]|nr:hypothetical protein [Planctomycetota bacterium]